MLRVIFVSLYLYEDANDSSPTGKNMDKTQFPYESHALLDRGESKWARETS